MEETFEGHRACFGKKLKRNRESMKATAESVRTPSVFQALHEVGLVVLRKAWHKFLVKLLKSFHCQLISPGLEAVWIQKLYKDMFHLTTFVHLQTS